LDDDLYSVLVKLLPSNANLFCVMDCCYSGSVLDLPNQFKAGQGQRELQIDEHFNFNKLLNKFGHEIPGLFDD